MNDQHLFASLHWSGLLVNDLRKAGEQSSAVLNLTILPLIAEAAELKRKITAILEAINADA